MQKSNIKLRYLIRSYLLLVLVLLTTEFSKIYWSLSTNLYSVIQEIIPLILTIVIISLVQQKILLEINKTISIIILFLFIIISISAKCLFFIISTLHCCPSCRFSFFQRSFFSIFQTQIFLVYCRFHN